MTPAQKVMKTINLDTTTQVSVSVEPSNIVPAKVILSIRIKSQVTVTSMHSQGRSYTTDPNKGLPVEYSRFIEKNLSVSDVQRVANVTIQTLEFYKSELIHVEG